MGYLENLPHLVITEILPHLSHKDKLSFRKTSKRLYQITTQSDPQFKVWSFYINKGIPPDFVLESRKMFYVYIDYIEDNPQGREQAQLISMFLKSYADRIKNIDIKNIMVSEGNLGRLFGKLVKLKPDWKNLKNVSLKMVCVSEVRHLFECGRTTVEHLNLSNFLLNSISPIMFTNLKTLRMKDVCYAKILEVPQLEKLELIRMDDEFHIYKNTALPKLKTLIISESRYIGLHKIFSKCYSTVESVHLDKNGTYMMFDPKGFNFPVLKSFKFNGSGKNVIEFIKAACESLTSLELTLGSQVNFGPLTSKCMKIETAKFDIRRGTKKVVQFLNSCANLTSLELTDFFDPSAEQLDLKRLTILRLHDCYDDCLRWMLEASKSSLKILEITWMNGIPDFSGVNLPAIKSLDFVSVLFDDPTEILQPIVNQFAALFEGNVQARREGTTRLIMRRFYNLHSDDNRSGTQDEAAAGGSEEQQDLSKRARIC